MNPSESVLSHPSVQRIVRVASALGDLARDVVFIGGSVAPLLHVDPLFPRPRPTRDVDAVIATRNYADIGRCQERLRARGFRQDPTATHHVHRWVSPDQDLLDLVPAGAHLGGSAQRWDMVALETSVDAEMGGGVTIRHASAPAFLALKWAAYRDRGEGDAFASPDLEDILALMAARPGLVGEVIETPAEIVRFVAVEAARLLQRPEIEDLLAAHLNNAPDPAVTCRRVRESLVRLAALDRDRMERPRIED